MSFRTLATLFLLLAACSQSALPLDPVYDSDDLSSFSATFNSIAVSPASVVLPGSGSATYSGFFGGNLGAGGSVLGNLGLSVDFGGSSVAGGLSNINVLGVAGVEDQTLSGDVAFTGWITGTTMSALGSGNLTIVDGIAQTGTASVTVFGQFRDYLGFYDAVSGTIELDASSIGLTEASLEFYAQ